MWHKFSIYLANTKEHNCPVICLSKWPYHFAVPSAIRQSSCWSPCSPAFGGVSILVYGHLSTYVGVSHCGFNLHFPDDTRCKASFQVLLLHLCIILVRYLFRAFDHFLSGFFNFLIVKLYNLDNSPLFRYIFYKYFLPIFGLFSYSLEGIYF